jgi:predicted MFS family arabinose efflux permease
MARDIAEALRYLWAHRFLRTLALSAGMFNVAMAAYWGVFVLWVVGAESRMGLEPDGYGLMLTALAAGALAGSYLSERITRPGREAATLVVMWAVSGLLHLVPVLLPTAWLLYPTAVAWGLAGAVGNVLVVSIRQRLIPSALLGRVNSAYRLIGMGGMPLGAALGGVMGELAGLPAVFLSAVGLCAMAVCLVWRVALKPISHHVTSDHTVDSTSGSLSAH